MTPYGVSSMTPYSLIKNLTIAVTLIALAAPCALSAEVTHIIDSHPKDEGDVLDVTVTADWEMKLRSGKILREFRCLAHDTSTASGQTLCPNGSGILDARELVTNRHTQRLNLKAVMGFWRNAQIGVHLPVVLYDQTDLGFDQGVGDTGRDNSTVDPYTQPSLFPVPDEGAARSGIGDLSFMTRFTPLSFARDATRATWALDFGLTIPTGTVKEANNKAVGEGLWAIQVATAVSSRPTRWVEPYFQVGAKLLVPSEDSLFKDYNSSTQTLVSPGHIIHASAGLELMPYEDRRLKRGVTIDIGGRLDFHFEGREYTDLFDALGGSPCDPKDPITTCELTTFDRGDIDPATGRRMKTDGITDVEQYANLSSWIGVRYQPIPEFQLLARFAVENELPHFLTTADAGRDLDKAEDNAVEQSNSFGINEFNPVYNEVYDALGSRFRSGGMITYVVSVGLQGRF
jgi:hypothetical protein